MKSTKRFFTVFAGLALWLPVFAADSNDIQVVTMSMTNRANGYLETTDVFTRAGQTNLIRRTHTRSGAVLFRDQTFYYNGVAMGNCIYNGRQTIIGSIPGAQYPVIFLFDSSSNPRSGIIDPKSAVISTLRTNNAPLSITVVTLDSFGCSNGVFYPRDGLWIHEVNSMSSTTVPLP